MHVNPHATFFVSKRVVFSTKIGALVHQETMFFVNWIFSTQVFFWPRMLWLLKMWLSNNKQNCVNECQINIYKKKGDCHFLNIYFLGSDGFLINVQLFYCSPNAAGTQPLCACFTLVHWQYRRKCTNVLQNLLMWLLQYHLLHSTCLLRKFYPQHLNQSMCPLVLLLTYGGPKWKRANKGCVCFTCAFFF